MRHMAKPLTVAFGGTSLLLHQNTRRSITRHAWNILTSLREPRSNARLLVDLFDQALLERRLHAAQTHVLDDDEDVTAAVLPKVRRSSRKGTAVRGISVKGGLPMDLAKLIDSFVPNHVQSMVMNV